MEITMQPIKNDQAVAQLQMSNQTTQRQTSHLGTQSPSSISKSDGSGHAAATKDVFSGAATTPAKEATGRLVALQNVKNGNAMQILAVRTSKTVEVQLESAKQKMNEITNSYPPFLRGSEQRQQYLMSISSIRKQIESMIIPPVQLQNPTLDAASSNVAKGMWTELFQDIAIPALATNGPNEASDAQIRVASSEVGSMLSDLSGRRVALEQQLVPAAQISSPMAQSLSEVAGQRLAKTDISLTYNLTGALKGM